GVAGIIKAKRGGIDRRYHLAAANTRVLHEIAADHIMLITKPPLIAPIGKQEKTRVFDPARG
ncbi:hypothetical protein NZA98_10125, partial [Escherichia coli]|nr:hypothetical protein [Escherichia coli]